jgi:hypothetical protein
MSLARDPLGLVKLKRLLDFSEGLYRLHQDGELKSVDWYPGIRERRLSA